MEKSLEEVKNSLHDIQDKLYSGEIPVEELNKIVKKLEYLKEEMEEIVEENNYCNKLINNILKGLKIIANLLPLLSICFMILNFIIGIIFFLLTLLFRWIVKRGTYLESTVQNKNEQLISQILEDIEYKKEITNKKIKSTKRLKSLENNSQEVKPNLSKIPKIEMVRILELKN